jgi:hypothetical protein
MRKLYDLSGGVEHDGEKGAFREFFVASLVRLLMPAHFGFGAGVVVSVSGQQSRPGSGDYVKGVDAGRTTRYRW